MKFFSIFPALVASLILCVTGEEKVPNESLILGMYRTVNEDNLKSEDFNEFLKAMEYSDEDREKMRNCKEIRVRIGKDNKTPNMYVFEIAYGSKATLEHFKLGEEFNATLCDGRKYKATMYFADNVITRVEKHGSFESRHVATFSREGHEVELTAKNKTAKLRLERYENS